MPNPKKKKHNELSESSDELSDPSEILSQKDVNNNNAFPHGNLIEYEFDIIYQGLKFDLTRHNAFHDSPLDLYAESIRRKDDSEIKSAIFALLVYTNHSKLFKQGEINRFLVKEVPSNPTEIVLRNASIIYDYYKPKKGYQYSLPRATVTPISLTRDEYFEKEVTSKVIKLESFGRSNEEREDEREDEREEEEEEGEEDE